MNGRRDFLKAIAAFPAIVPSSALGRDGYVAPSERVVMATIGLGRMGSADMREFLAQQEVHVAAVCDVNQANLERGQAAVNKTYGDTACKGYADFRELLARPDIDAVVIATGERWHPLISIEAANRGKHMYTEKPLALSIAEAKAVREAVTRNNVCFQFGTQQRSSFYYRHAVELVRNGRIGDLQTIMIGSAGGTLREQMFGTPKEPPPGFDYDMWLGPSQWAPYSDLRVSIAAWLFISDYGLGSMDGSWGVHDIDIAQWLADADRSVPVEAEGSGLFFTDIRDVAYSFTFEQRYANGVRLIYMDMVSAKKRAPEFNLLPSTGATVIFGSKGWIFVSRDGLITNPPHLVSEKIGPNDIQVIRSANHRKNLIDAIRRGQKTISPVEAAVRDQFTVQQNYIALKLRRKVRWDPVREEFIGDAEANRMMSRPMRAPWHV